MKKSLGQKGEMIAADYLRGKGYQVLHRNWFFNKKELDIIATDGRYLVITEVKTRIDGIFEKPDELISDRKIHLIVEAANAYVREFNIDMDVRFDVILVILGIGKPVIEHIERAFFPTIS